MNKDAARGRVEGPDWGHGLRARLCLRSPAPASETHGVYTANLTRSGANTSGFPLRFALAQNQPNTFAKAARIRFELPIKANRDQKKMTLLP